MRFILIFLLWFLFILGCLKAQSLEYAREIIDEICKPAYHGRGYVKDGDLKAAKYIASEYKKLNLEKLGDSYFQEFPIDVNTFPGSMAISLDGKTLIPGADFLIDPCSPSIKGNFELDYYSENRAIHNDHEKVIVIPAEMEFNKKDTIPGLGDDLAAIIKLMDGKLTWHIATEQCNLPVIYLKKELFDYQRHVRLNITADLLENYTTQNVMGYLPGQEQDSFLVFTAHYDHLGRMGKDTYFPGANDNASGVAMLLNMAKYFSNQDDRKYNILFLATGAEETGLLGSSYFVKNTPFDLNRIKFLVNFDIVGTGDDGITVVNGSVYKERFDRLQEINSRNDYLSLVKTRGEACNSDHCLFHLNGVPSFYIYTMGGIQAYHDIYDQAATLPLTEFLDYQQLVSTFLEEF